jgi:hypothetical protein
MQLAILTIKHSNSESESLPVTQGDKQLRKYSNLTGTPFRLTQNIASVPDNEAELYNMSMALQTLWTLAAFSVS